MSMRFGTVAAAALAAGVSFAAYSAHAAGDLNMICSADPQVCDLMKGLFEKQSDIKVNMVRLSAGETYAKIRAEARNPKTDIWWAGTGDPHLQAAPKASRRSTSLLFRPAAGLGQEAGRKRAIQGPLASTPARWAGATTPSS
jgi:hypothetical protein